TMFVNAYVEDKEKPDVKIIELLKKLYDKLEIEDVEQKFFAKNICLDLIIIYHNLNDAVNIQIWESAFEEINS
ncbi:MAG: hypothetical protein FWG51_02825, partial [Firmicutes bacterium]|nr:hypothetical protein [Bacillota bacterium]